MRFRSSDSVDLSQAICISLGCLNAAWKVVGCEKYIATGCCVGWFATALNADMVESGSVSKASESLACFTKCGLFSLHSIGANSVTAWLG